MKLFYNIIGTVFIALTVLFLFQGGWWQSFLCLLAAVIFFGMKGSSDALQKQVKTHDAMINALAFRMNNGGYVTEQNIEKILNKKSAINHGGIDR